MKPRHTFIALSALIILFLATVLAVQAWTAVPVEQDPLVHMPGTQPGQVSLESPNRCLNCHAGYNSAVEPGFNWQGSMMAQSSRDFLFWAAMTVGAQDSIFAIETPNATDICLRCHFPKGWLEGRSDPTNASLMTGADYDGVQCDFCHRMYDPFFEETYNGSRESSDWLAYWDETNASGTPSQAAADATYQEDATIAQSIVMFNGEPFFVNNLPASPTYNEAASGQYYISPNSAKRASFADADARHQMLYSRYHKSKYFCATCHDVSNPVLANLGDDPTQPLTTETDPASSYVHAERTFSEFMLSAYSQQGGAAGIGPFNPAVFNTSLANNNISKCQDCHMRDVSGAAANKNGAVVRPGGSVEHPESGQPLHDLTGGNVWISTVLASTVPSSANYDAVNDALLNQGAATLTLDLSQGQGIDPAALLAGANRSLQQLQLAASIENLAYDPVTGALSFRIQNQTGHKLISGFPEGRRMFVNVQAYDAGGNLLYELNPYDPVADTLKGLSYTYGPDWPAPQPLATDEAYLDELVYEVHPGSSLTGEAETFHFALADGRYKDNRIPPQGFDVNAAVARLAEPVWDGVSDLGYFTAAEYAGGYDEVALTIPGGAASVEVNLYYQTTSREYIEFLRNEIQGTGFLTLPSSAYVIQTDPFFDGLRAWGDTIWQLWSHNVDLPGATPVLMTQGTWGDSGGGCQAPVPTLLSADPGHQQVSLTWSDEHSADSNVTGYAVYYDQADKSQLVTELGLTTSYIDTGLTNGQTYCYMVTSQYESCESGYSNIICATPENQTQPPATAAQIVTGYYTGNGNNQTFVAASTFNAGDEVRVRVLVLDTNTGLPVSNATVHLTIGGPESLTLTSSPSDSAGWSDAVWNTKKPRGNQSGTLPGTYQATVTGITANGYTWDGVTIWVNFTIQ